MISCWNPLAPKGPFVDLLGMHTSAAANARTLADCYEVNLMPHYRTVEEVRLSFDMRFMGSPSQLGESPIS